MYYKIENQESEVYKKLHAMRTKELQIEKDNKDKINEKVELKWSKFIGHSGQQTFGRVTEFSGFQFEEPEKVDLKIWKRAKDYPEAFVPNLRSKLGKEMNEFLRHELKGHWFSIVYENLGMKHPTGRFTLPFVEISDSGVIIIFLDDISEPSDENVIEITKREFNELN